MKHHVYRTFLLMMAVSFVLMYGTMYLGLASSEHVHLNSMQLYMTLLMVAPMAVVMLLMMLHMYGNKALNLAIAAGSIAVFLVALWSQRTQAFVGDEQFLRSMIPHHSSAILMSEEADLRDPEVRELAAKILRTQQEEIAHMEAILRRSDTRSQ